MTALQLSQLFDNYRLACRTEAQLQEAIAACFDLHKVGYIREFRLTEKDRPDFMVGKIAVEVKINGSCSEVTRQLHRYAEHPDVEDLLLITTCSKHMRLPGHLNGKRIVTLWLGGTAAL